MLRFAPFVSVLALSIAACGGSTVDGGSSTSCSADLECNNAPSLTSEALGKCTKGACVCNPGIESASNGKCGNADGSIPSNCEEKGGMCFAPDSIEKFPANYHTATAADDATCGAYAGTNGGTDVICIMPDK